VLKSRKSFYSRHANTQRRTEGWACACAGYMALLPTRNILGGSSLGNNTFKRYFRIADLKETDHVANVVPESRPVCSGILFCKHSDPSFQWYLVVRNERFLHRE